MIELNDIYHPTLAYYFYLNLLLSFGLTTIITILAIYIILTQSKNAKIFKYLLINQLTWSYLFCALYCAEGNVPLSPIPAVYFVGILKHLSLDTIVYHIPINLFIGISYGQSYFFSSLYRISYASAFSKFQVWFEHPKKLTFTMIVALLILSVVIVGPFLVIKYDATSLFEEILTEYPILQELKTYEPSVFAAPMIVFPKNSTSFTIALRTFTFYIPLIYFAHLTIYIIFFRQVMNPKNSFSESTKKKFMILLYAKTVQISSATIFLLLPYIIQFTVYISKTKNGSLIAMISHFGPNYHLFFEILALLYFIKPYREYCAKLICC